MISSSLSFPRTYSTLMSSQAGFLALRRVFDCCCSHTAKQHVAREYPHFSGDALLPVSADDGHLDSLR